MSAKRPFGPAYFAGNTAALAVALWAAGRERRWRRALGPLLAHGAPVAFLGSLHTSGRGRTSEGLPALRAAVAAGTVLTALEPDTGLGRVAAPLALAVAGTEGYVRWYSRLTRAPSAELELGASFPADVAFLDTADGSRVTGEDLRGTPAALFFYRGNWCPLCVAQVAEMAARWQELEAMGVQVALVSGQDEQLTRELAGRMGVGFRYLRDEDLAVARRLGLLHEGATPPGLPGYDADAVLPTVLVLDASGRIVFADQTDNYRVRPEPETILTALRGTAPAAA